MHANLMCECDNIAEWEDEIGEMSWELEVGDHKFIPGGKWRYGDLHCLSKTGQDAFLMKCLMLLLNLALGT